MLLGVRPFPQVAAACCDRSGRFPCRLTGSADLFDEAFKQGLPGGLAAGRRPAYGLNGASYFGKVTPVICVSAGQCV